CSSDVCSSDLLALLLNEVRKSWFKRFVQTVSYLPHFMSIVIVVGMVMQLVSLNGTVNAIIGAFGAEPINFIQQASWFRTLYVSSEVWQTVGWGTILYLAALTQVEDRKSTRLNSSHVSISYAVFCLKKKTKDTYNTRT